jgi:hypothetical protein
VPTGHRSTISSRTDFKLSFCSQLLASSLVADGFRSRPRRQTPQPRDRQSLADFKCRKRPRECRQGVVDCGHED